MIQYAESWKERTFKRYTILAFIIVVMITASIIMIMTVRSAFHGFSASQQFTAKEPSYITINRLCATPESSMAWGEQGRALTIRERGIFGP